MARSSVSDVIIVGGGIAGATLGGVLARAGLTTAGNRNPRQTSELSDSGVPTAPQDVLPVLPVE